MDKSLKNISALLLEKWKANDNIDEMHLQDFFSCILDNLIKRQEKLSVSYQKFSSIIGELWHYRDFERLSKEQAFLYGSIWGSMRLLSMKERRLQEQKNLELYVEKYKNKEGILKYLYQSPRIKHKELAKKRGISPSQLTQQILAYEREGLVSHDRIGREKYYYLLVFGEKVYEEIERRKETKVIYHMSEIGSNIMENSPYRIWDMDWEHRLFEHNGHRENVESNYMGYDFNLVCLNNDIIDKVQGEREYAGI